MADRETMNVDLQDEVRETDPKMSDAEVREELEREKFLRQNWPDLYTHYKQKEREREASERERREREESEKIMEVDESKGPSAEEMELKKREEQLKKREEKLKEEMRMQRAREDCVKKLKEIEDREKEMKEKERILDQTIRKAEEMRKALEKKSKEKEELLKKKIQIDFKSESGNIMKHVEAFANEIRLRLEALSSMYNQVDTEAGPSGLQQEKEKSVERLGVQLEGISMTDESEESEQREFFIPLKIGQHKWKQGEDYRIWRRIMCLEFAKYDCLFLIDPRLKPRKKYSADNISVMENSMMAYLLSNFPENHQHMLESCDTPKEMIRVLDCAIVPPSNTLENALQIELINLYFDPAKETVIEFRARVQKLINNIRRNPEAELTPAQIRRQVIGAISNAYPKLAEQAIEDKSISLGYVFDKMCERLDRHHDNIRRAHEAALLVGAPFSKAGTSGPRKRKAPAVHGDSAAVDKSTSTCYKCGFRGHWIAECRNPCRGCYNCKGFGHEARNCKKPPTKETLEWRKKHSVGKKFKKSKKEHTPAQARLTNKKPAPKGNPKGNKHPKSVVKKVEPERVVAAIATRRVRGTSADSSISFASAMSLEGKNGQLNFIADSGACEHMVNDISVFAELRTLAVPITILCANKDENASLEVTQAGDIIVFNQETKRYALLTDVLYAPNLLQNLFAIRKQIDRGLVAQFTNNTLEIVDKDTGEILKRGPFIGKFWWLSFELPMVNQSHENNVRMVREMRSQLNLTALEESQTGFGTEKPEMRKLVETSKKESLKRKESQLESKNKNKRSKPASCEKAEGSNKLETEVGEIGVGSKSKEDLRVSDSIKWHHRLNHASRKYLELASKVMPELKGIKFGTELFDCSSCKLAKAKRKPCSSQRHRSEQSFHRLYSDLVGPLKPGAFRTQEKYFVTFTDDATRYAFAYEIGDKTKVHRALGSCLEDIRKLCGPGMKVSELRIDGGLEYKTMEMRELLKSESIAVTTCAPYTPQHNGTAERLNLEIEEKIRVNLIASGLPTYLWPFTMRHVLHVHNRTPNASNEFRSPYEVLKNEVPSIKHLRRYGCEAYVLDPKAKQKPKFAPRANLHFLVECGETGYTLFHPVNRTVTRSKDVDFIESRTYTDYKSDSEKRTQEMSPELSEFEQTSAETETELEIAPPSDTPDTSVRIESEKELVEPVSSSSKKIGETNEFDFFEEETDEANLICLAESGEPTDELEPVTYKDAMSSPNAAQWEKAINQEFDALENCKTWKIINRKAVPKGTKVMTTRWVHKRKIEANGDIRFRSRLVVRGFADTNAYELSEIYAPVARLPDVRFILIAAAKYGLELNQLDVKTAFLNGSLEKLVYIELPEGYSTYLGKKVKPNTVCEVHRALYGLKVSPRRWFERFLEAVERLQFEPYQFQACLFIWREGNKLAIMLLYVDDILLASNCSKKTAEVKAMLKREFSITDLGTPKKFLGMEIERKETGEIRLHQRAHIESMLKKFHIKAPRKYDTPMLPEFGDGTKTVKEDSNWSRENIPYRSAIGILLYLLNGTRPDIAYAVNVLSRRQADFTETHWKAVLRVMGYLSATKDYSLKFSPNSETIDCYVDASLGMSAEKGHSTTGFIIFLFGCPVTWRTQKQNHVALSSAEAEFVAMSKACRELANLRNMCSEILTLQIIPRILEDSKPAIRLAEVDDSTTLKHLVRLSYLYVREEYKKGNVTIQWVGTDQQIADTFTKPLSRNKFAHFRDSFMSK